MPLKVLALAMGSNATQGADYLGDVEGISRVAALDAADLHWKLPGQRLLGNAGEG